MRVIFSFLLATSFLTVSCSSDTNDTNNSDENEIEYVGDKLHYRQELKNNISIVLPTAYKDTIWTDWENSIVNIAPKHDFLFSTDNDISGRFLMIRFEQKNNRTLRDFAETEFDFFLEKADDRKEQTILNQTFYRLEDWDVVDGNYNCLFDMVNIKSSLGPYWASYWFGYVESDEFFISFTMYGSHDSRDFIKKEFLEILKSVSGKVGNVRPTDFNSTSENSQGEMATTSLNDGLYSYGNNDLALTFTISSDGQSITEIQLAYQDGSNLFAHDIVGKVHSDDSSNWYEFQTEFCKYKLIIYEDGGAKLEAFGCQESNLNALFELN